jgi:Protein of unknown function DUF262
MQMNLDFVAVGELRHRFLIPAYQRGYRWGTDEVLTLLNDIAEINDKSDEDYCLQPVVVRKLDDGRYELVDGQQRLTTLYLLFLAMQKEGFKPRSPPPFGLEYATRPQSAEFLRELEPTRSKENVDFFHISQAYDSIVKWFSDLEPRAQVMADEVNIRLHKRVKVIWYEADADVDSTALFARLNIGRIPLTNAELLKALLLKRSGNHDIEERRQVEIGMQWDALERELHDESLWAFLTNRDSILYPTRIELLFDLMADRRSADRFFTFRHFKKLLDTGTTRDDIWNDVLSRFEVLREWHTDRDLYHRIGFLVATGAGDSDLRALLHESATTTKSSFNEALHAKLVERLDLGLDSVDDLDYTTLRFACERVLLFFNVESTRRLRASTERFPFDAWKRRDWSLEHIHAQNAEEFTKGEQWREWLMEHANALVDLRLTQDETTARDELVSAIHASLSTLTKEVFVDLANRVLTIFSRTDEPDEGDGLHSIENLALLPRDLNSALNNAAFEVKRRRILAADRRGEYIPICTRRAFLKYYTDSGDQQLQMWSRQDREAYRAAMFSDVDGVLAPYLRRDS